eukprot:106227_1
MRSLGCITDFFASGGMLGGGGNGSPERIELRGGNGSPVTKEEDNELQIVKVKEEEEEPKRDYHKLEQDYDDDEEANVIFRKIKKGFVVYDIIQYDEQTGKYLVCWNDLYFPPIKYNNLSFNGRSWLSCFMASYGHNVKRQKGFVTVDKFVCSTFCQQYSIWQLLFQRH